jgi:hypothetical protein
MRTAAQQRPSGGGWRPGRREQAGEVLLLDEASKPATPDYPYGGKGQSSASAASRAAGSEGAGRGRA